MRKFVMASAATAAMIGASLIGSAQAAPVGLPDGVRTAIDHLNIIEAARMWNDQSYCWYGDGWNGAGWYQCGYAKRRGYGWGGPYGWHGWGSHMMGRKSHDVGKSYGWETSSHDGLVGLAARFTCQSTEGFHGERWLKGMALFSAAAVPLLASATTAEAKASKSAVHYQDFPNGMRTCSMCKFFISAGGGRSGMMGCPMGRRHDGTWNDGSRSVPTGRR